MTRSLKSFMAAAALCALPFASVPAMAGGTITVANATDSSSWDPIDTFTLDWGRVGSNIFDALIQRSNDLKLNPGLALSWEVMDDKHIRFKLRPNVKFHDGTAFNAEAVKFCFDRQLNDKSPYYAMGTYPYVKSFLGNIAGVEVVDPQTLQKLFAVPSPGWYVVISSRPVRTLTALVGTRPVAVPAPPEMAPNVPLPPER